MVLRDHSTELCQRALNYQIIGDNLVRKCNAIAAIIGVFLFLGGDGSLAIGAAVPFAEDFSGSAPDFTYSSSSGNVTAVVGSDVLTIDSTLATGGQALNAMVDISNADGMPIVMEMDITPIDWLANGGHSSGFLAFSTNPELGLLPGGPNSGYLADFVMSSVGAGYIRLFNLASVATIVDSQSTLFPSGSLAVNETYRLTFTATPGLGGVLDLSLTITDTTGTLIDDDGIVTISAVTPDVASTGTFFGLRHRVGNNGTGANRRFDAMYDNFSIAEAPDPTLEGDYNGDGDVDAADYVLWRKDPAAFGGTPDGYNTWRAHFGEPGGSGSALGTSSAVPEPGTLFLTLVAGLGLMGRRWGTSNRG